MAAATIGLGLIRGDGKLAWTGGRMLIAHTLATWGKSVIKGVTDRTRPNSGEDPEVRAGDSDTHEDNSFPSGHSASAFAVAQAVARVYPEHGLVVRGSALAVSAIKVPRGTHYLGDVVAGIAIGVSAEHVAAVIVSTLARKPI